MIVDSSGSNHIVREEKEMGRKQRELGSYEQSTAIADNGMKVQNA